MRFSGFRLPGLAASHSPMGLGIFPFSGETATRLIEQQGFGANPGALRMFLYAPPSLPSKAPLVVILHGCTQNAAGYDAGTGWSELAARAGFAVLAPEQTRANNVNGCFNWFQSGDTARCEGEAASIRQMIEYAVTVHALDRGRIFITGLSAGGAMTAAMLGAYPEVFAGGAVIAGLPVGAATNVAEAVSSMRRAPDRLPEAWGALVRGKSDHAGPWPRLSVWHGDADETVHPGNAEALIAQWACLHGAGAVSDDTQEGYRRRSWQDKTGKEVVEAVTVSGMGHGAPVSSRQGAGIGQAGLYFPDMGLSSTTHIAAFWGLVARAKAPSGHTGNSMPRRTGKLQGPLLAALRAAGMLKR